MIDSEGYYTYEGIHCASQCSLARSGKMCQCRYDRLYERQTMEHPGTGVPKIKAESDLTLVIGVSK